MKLNRLFRRAWVPPMFLIIVAVCGPHSGAAFTPPDRYRAPKLTRDKSGPNQQGRSVFHVQMVQEPLLRSSGSFYTERGGFEPPVQVYPVQQFSKLSP